MQPVNHLYPVSPRQVPATITEPRAAYKKEVGKTMTAVVLFFVVYIILIGLSIALSIACVYAGVMLMAALSHWIGIIAGLGIISIGIMVFVFLVKFIFSVKKHDESKTVSISENEQPQLFAFIRQLTNDTQTQFPKKIVLSADVNACVYYNDSFWSMFFPVRKNLQIGLGLVNSLTLGEFKAVMAHEFGHFSQKSMKLGSFVYNVNKVIYNMLYENKDYGKFLSGWGSIHAIISLFVWVTVQIIKGIQKVLEGMYSLINKSYMRLSREMEFHADAVAAGVSGSNNCISALKKIELSDMCFNTVMSKADMYLQKNEVLGNLYSKHNVVMQQYATEYDLPLKNNVPVLTDEFLKRFQLSKVNIQNQWASHPSIEDRVARLQTLSVTADEDNRSSWVLFNNSTQLQQQLTSVVYNHLPDIAKQATVDETEFEKRYKEDADTYRLPAAYNGYYDNRQMNEMDFEKVFATASPLPLSKETIALLFSDDKVALPRQLAAIQSDAELIQAIANKQIDVKTFDYDGDKYNRSEAQSVLDTINTAAEKIAKEIQQDEETNAVFFYTVAASVGAGNAAALKEMYTTHFANRKKAEEFTTLYGQVNQILAPLIHGQTVTVEAAAVMATDLQDESEKIKTVLRYFIAKGMVSDEESVKTLQQFNGSDYKYFANGVFHDHELASLQKTLSTALTSMGEFQFKRFKELLQFQLSFL
jgi:Zn-dependent protease with chaperone function